MQTATPATRLPSSRSEAPPLNVDQAVAALEALTGAYDATQSPVVAQSIDKLALLIAVQCPIGDTEAVSKDVGA